MKEQTRTTMVKDKNKKPIEVNDNNDKVTTACEAFVKALTKDEEDAMERVVDNLDNNWDAFINELGEQGCETPLFYLAKAQYISIIQQWKEKEIESYKGVFI